MSSHGFNYFKNKCLDCSATTEQTKFVLFLLVVPQLPNQPAQQPGLQTPPIHSSDPTATAHPADENNEPPAVHPVADHGHRQHGSAESGLQPLGRQRANQPAAERQLQILQCGIESGREREMKRRLGSRDVTLFICLTTKLVPSQSVNKFLLKWKCLFRFVLKH